ncbi:Formyltransferase [Suhomyces tanzawaensis NRRL Y-17324]|uniref:methionyl-tRNA formyltransferase n=1 Tax=Suhomyces tanzawaensis NRRL Y-17324 TaxID=984487 RepID=A0A1E4SEI4_9ASCO|nr:Formyltransferase [Suhomyces tanzawaensis NRRL Y-17324]ODV77802.1 Formyltransferase [Suhomyces tanzawaensis NRRL Y-17324]
MRFILSRLDVISQTKRVFGVRLRNILSLSPEKLRIALFGSDEFSVHSLEKLLKFQKEHPLKIESIHVITRSIKSRGRKSKIIQDLPIATYLLRNNPSIEIIRADSAQEISNINDRFVFDLSIAVAYGILIPQKFIENCKYGGINVHPSLLPRHSGSSPLQYALMKNDSYTGCTVQTLHPTKFDKGDILIQSEEIPIEHEDNFDSLQYKLGRIGANLLIKVISEDMYLSPKERVPQKKYEFSLAAKIPAGRAEILWSKYTTLHIISLTKALGTLFSYKQVCIKRKKADVNELQKVNFREISQVDIKDLSLETVKSLKGEGDFTIEHHPNPRIIVKTIDGFIAIQKLTFQCYNEELPEKFSSALTKRAGSTSNTFLQKM